MSLLSSCRHHPEHWVICGVSEACFGILDVQCCLSSVYEMVFAAWLTGQAQKFSGLAGIAWKSTSGAKNEAFYFPCFSCAGIKKKKLRKHYETC